MAEADSNVTLDEFANSGLYGVVWKGTQLCPGRTVAIKIVNLEHGMKFNAVEHAHGLVKAGPHPNIVDVYQVTHVLHPQTNEVVEAVIMEWLDGNSVGHALSASTLLRPSDARSICEGVISGISHLHANGVTHSDLHMGNVIVTSQGPRIIDIDYSSVKSLSLLTTLSRDFRIQSDVNQTAHIIGSVIRKTDKAQQFYNDNEQRLRSATTLLEVSAFVTDFFEYAAPEPTPSILPAVIVPPRNLSVEEDSLYENVESAIENKRRIALRRLIMGRANGVAEKLADKEYSAKAAYGKEKLRERVEKYKAATQSLLPTLGLLGYWGGTFSNALAVESVDRIANAHERDPLENGNSAYLSLRKYPVAASLYAVGIGAVARENYRGLFDILRKTVFYEHGRDRRKLWTELAYWSMESRDVWNESIGRDLYFPVSQVLEEDLREPFNSMIPSNLRYVDQFDRFELFASLDHFLFNGRALGASFLWRRQKRKDSDLISEIRLEAEAAGKRWAPLRAGLLAGTSKTDVLGVLDEFRQSAQEVSAAFRIW